MASGFPPERRDFKPHLTLGRWRDPAPRPKLPARADLGSGALDRLALFRSELRRTGSEYTPLATFSAGLARCPGGGCTRRSSRRAYLLGSIPFSYSSRGSGGVDVRTVGSGNVGATNVMRSVGKARGRARLRPRFRQGLAGDAAGARRRWAAPHSRAWPRWWPSLGHMHPVWLRFRGGKGVATGAGAFLPLAPAATRGRAPRLRGRRRWPRATSRWARSWAPPCSACSRSCSAHCRRSRGRRPPPPSSSLEAPREHPRGSPPGRSGGWARLAALRVAVVGAGSWGTALAVHLARAGHEVRLWARRRRDARPRSRPATQRGATFPGSTLPPLAATTDLADAVAGAEAVARRGALRVRPRTSTARSRPRWPRTRPSSPPSRASSSTPWSG